MSGECHRRTVISCYCHVRFNIKDECTDQIVVVQQSNPGGSKNIWIVFRTTDVFKTEQFDVSALGFSFSFNKD